MHDQAISKFEDTVAAMQVDFEKTLCASTASQKELQDSLMLTKHELLRVQDQLTLAEKVLFLNVFHFYCTANNAVLHNSLSIFHGFVNISIITMHGYQF